MDKLSIGEMSKVNNVSTQTLRLYDKLGLLKPQYVNGENGYRYYSIKQSAQLDMIQYMKAIGMSLNEIKEQMDKGDIDLVKDVLKIHRDNIINEINQLKQKKSSVERVIGNYNRYHALPGDGTIVVEYIPERKIYCFESGVNFYDYGIEVYEMMLRELKKHLIENNLSTAYFCNAGTVLRHEHLEKREFISTEVFLFVDDEFSALEKTQRISENTYLCIYCDSFYKEKEYANKLFEYAEKNGCKMIGDYICEVVVELPIFHFNERNMYIKLQVPVSFK